VVLFEEEEKKENPAETTTSILKKSCTPAEAKKVVARLQDELSNAKQSHQMTIEELETSNEELQSANEELQSSNEELQSTNEELETSREEMQSLNEELATVNTELQEKVQEESKMAEEMQSLLSNMDIATIFLDSDLRILRFTPQATNVTNLLDRDIGRSFGDIKKTVLDTDVDALIQEVDSTGTPKQLEVRGEDGRWYFMRVIPYREAGEQSGGIALTFVDMSEIAGLKEAYRGLISASAQVLYRMNPDWSEMRKFHGGAFIADTEKSNRNWLNEHIHPDDQKRALEVIHKAVKAGSIFELEHRVLRIDGTVGWTASRAAPVRDATGEIVQWVWAASDITKIKLNEEKLAELEEEMKKCNAELKELKKGDRR